MVRRQRLVWSNVAFLLWLTACAGTRDRPLFLAISPSRASAELTLDADAYATADEPFIEHLGIDGSASYLAMTVPFAPVRAVREQLEEVAGRPIQHRGEAHITIVTPPEYKSLAPDLSMERIHEIARATGIQAMPFAIECLGRGEATLDGRIEHTYFLVVTSVALRGLRRQIYAAFVEAGGDVAAWDPQRWDPHITVGFTRRDLYAQDGVRKDEGACWREIKVRPAGRRET